MNNYWLAAVEKKKIIKSIDDLGMEVWSEDGTFGDFVSSLSKDEKKMLCSFMLSDFSCDHDEGVFRLELLIP